jgi:hypothetical protein
VSLASTIASLTTRRDAAAAELAALTVDGPDISLDGVSIQDAAYVAERRKEVAELTLLIEQLSGPVVVYTQGR